MRRTGWGVIAVVVAACAVAAERGGPGSDEEREDDDVDRARITTVTMLAYLNAVQGYRVDEERYPETRFIDELKAILEPDYAEDLPTVDGWGHHLRYESASGPTFLLASPGRDGVWEHESWMDYRGAVTGDVDADLVIIDEDFLRYPYGGYDLQYCHQRARRDVEVLRRFVALPAEVAEGWWLLLLDAEEPSLWARLGSAGQHWSPLLHAGEATTLFVPHGAVDVLPDQATTSAKEGAPGTVTLVPGGWQVTGTSVDASSLSTESYRVTSAIVFEGDLVVRLEGR